MIIDVIAALLFPVIVIGIPVAAGLAYNRSKVLGIRERCWAHRNRMPAMLYSGDRPEQDLCPQCQYRYRRIEDAERRKEVLDAWYDQVMQWRRGV